MRPVLYDFGNLKIYSYGFMMVMGYLSVLLFLYVFSPKTKIPRQEAIDLSFYVFLSGIVGSRVIYILLNLGKYMSDWRLMFEFQKGGLSWHGGLLGAFICIFIYSAIKKLPVGEMSDLLCTPVLVGLAFGRIGCFLNGCCYGTPCSLPWGVVFPNSQGVAVHPTQFYELILDVAATIFLIFWWKKRKFEGENSLLMLGLYSIIRFIVESFRYNTPAQMISGLSLAQWVSVGMFVIIFSAVLALRSKSKSTLEERRLEEKETDNPEPGGEDVIPDAELEARSNEN